MYYNIITKNNKKIIKKDGRLYYLSIIANKEEDIKESISCAYYWYNKPYNSLETQEYYEGEIEKLNEELDKVQTRILNISKKYSFKQWQEICTLFNWK